MEVRIDRRFELPVSPEEAWRLLSDLPATAACMPGVTVTRQESETVYHGRMRARIGPATMDFQGRVEVRQLDAAQRCVRLLGKGGDTAGSSAVMDLQARVEPGATPASCQLVSETTVAVSGRVAQFGSRLLLPVADTLLRNFIANFAQEAGRRAAAANPVQAPATASVAVGAPAAAIPVAPPLSVLALLRQVLRRWWTHAVRPRVG